MQQISGQNFTQDQLDESKSITELQVAIQQNKNHSTLSQSIIQQSNQNKNQNLRQVENEPSSKPKVHKFKLNPNNPEDRALALVMKLMVQQQQRQNKQEKIIEELRKSRVVQNCGEIGEINRIISKQNYMSNHYYLRQNHYRTISVSHRLSNSQTMKPIQQKNEKKRITVQQLKLLERSKVSTKRYEIKKMMGEFVGQLIAKAVDLVIKKKRFYFGAPPKKIYQLLNDQWERQLSKSHKKQLHLSRVYEMRVENTKQQEQQGEQASNQQDGVQSNQSSSDQSSNSDDKDSPNEQNDSSSINSSRKDNDQQDSNSQD